MILAAAVGVGLAWSAWSWARVRPGRYPSKEAAATTDTVGLEVRPWGSAAWFAHEVSVAAAPLLACLAVGLLAVRWRERGGRLGRLWASAGDVAGAAVLAAIALQAVRLSYLLQAVQHPSRVNWVRDTAGDVLGKWLLVEVANPAGVGLMVAGAWAALLASGRWRPGADANDRLARAIGIAWIVGLMLALVVDDWPF